MHTEYTYDHNSNLLTIRDTNGHTITTYSYDAAGRVLSIQHANEQKELGAYTYTYDARGNLTRVVEKLLTGADGKVTLWIPAGSYRFRADQFDLQFFSGETNHCTVPECTAATVSTLGMQQVVTEQTIDYTDDANGNLLADGTKTYTYNYSNRLTNVTFGTDAYQHVYKDSATACKAFSTAQPPPTPLTSTAV